MNKRYLKDVHNNQLSLFYEMRKNRAFGESLKKLIVDGRMLDNEGNFITIRKREDK